MTHASSAHGRFDAIVFDCDGVLIDVRESYELAIAQTARHALAQYAGVSSIGVGPEIIEGFKSTGGFNDEVDLTYAAVLSLAAADSLRMRPRKFIWSVISNADESGIGSVERYLESMADLSQLRSALAYPDSGRAGPLNALFDQIFYGSHLYGKIFSRQAEIEDPGLIGNDKVIATEGLLKSLSEMLDGKMAIVTGRGAESIRHSMGGLMRYFKADSCMFLEDEARSMAKPNPEPLLRAISTLSSDRTLYVGDSMEDLLMARRATKAGCDTAFCGIVGTAHDPQARRRLFESEGAYIVLDSILDIPDAVRLA